MRITRVSPKTKLQIQCPVDLREYFQTAEDNIVETYIYIDCITIILQRKLVLYLK